MIRTVIIDDEPFVVKNIEFLLSRYCPQLTVAGTAGTAIEGKKLIASVQPQLVFLDIEMPHGNGFDLLNYFEQIDFQIIIISAFEQYAVKAFKYEAVDYLLKPIDAEELTVAVNKATDRIKQHKFPVSGTEFTPLTNQNQENKLTLNTNRGLIFVQPEMILYCQSNGNYTYIYLTNGTEHLVTRQLGEYEKILPAIDFCRVHNEYIINTKHVASYIKGRGGVVVLTNGKHVNVSAKKKNEFLSRYKEVIDK